MQHLAMELRHHVLLIRRASCQARAAVPIQCAVLDILRAALFSLAKKETVHSVSQANSASLGVETGGLMILLRRASG